jgi:phosphoribosyl 1,2-cyclic phosphodiesterase
MSLKFCTITSGSSGNCIYIGTKRTQFLIDAGISGKKVENGLKEVDIDPKGIKGIFITHEHSDHIKGIGVLSRRYDIPLFATQKTWEALDGLGKIIGKIHPDHRQIIEKDTDLVFDDLIVHPYSIPHDAADPVGYTFCCENKKISMATDLGCVNDHIKNNIRESNLILLEANHDINMLKVGGYPYFLKQRILGDRGHLCNETAGNILTEIYHEQLETVILGHLSKENNLPDLAYITVKNELEQAGISVSEQIELSVASREKNSKLYCL